MSEQPASKEPVFPDYLAKWSRVNLVAHEQERSAREEHARDWSAWARSEIARLQRLIARVVEWQPPFPVEASLLDELASAAKGVSTHEPPAPASKEKVSSGTLRSLLRGCHPEQPLASQFVATHILRAMCEELLTHRPEHRCGVQGFDPMRDKCPACSPDEPLAAPSLIERALAVLQRSDCQHEGCKDGQYPTGRGMQECTWHDEKAAVVTALKQSTTPPPGAIHATPGDALLDAYAARDAARSAQPPCALTTKQRQDMIERLVETGRIAHREPFNVPANIAYTEAHKAVFDAMGSTQPPVTGLDMSGEQTGDPNPLDIRSRSKTVSTHPTTASTT